MADSGAAVAPASTPKKKVAGKAKKPKAAPSHPKTADMVTAAITNLKERGGSSLQAIKKYIATTYKVDVKKLAPFIRKYLKTAVSNGSVVQTKGSFKLSASAKPEKKAKSVKPRVKKATKSKPAAASKPKKAKSPKKAPAAAKPKKAKSPKKAAKATKFSKKSPKKPKSPKVKKAKASGKK